MRQMELREAEAAPTAGAAPESPDSPETSNDQHFDALQKQLGIDSDEFQAAIEGGVVTLYKVPDFGWGFHPNPPIQASVEDRGDGTYNVTFMLSMMPKNSFTLPYVDKENPYYFKGNTGDRTEVMTQKELIGAMVPPYEGGGAAGAPMGGDPMMGGGMDPMMGAPPGGMI